MSQSTTLVHRTLIFVNFQGKKWCQHGDDECTADTQQGGAIKLWGGDGFGHSSFNSSIVARQLTVRRCSGPANGGGGGIAVEVYRTAETMTVDIADSVFEHNTAGYGAAIYYWTSTPAWPDEEKIFSDVRWSA